MAEVHRKTGATLNRGDSKQDYGTPREFLDAVEKRFGPIAFDLAAHSENAVCRDYFGPGSDLAEDSLKVRWDLLPGVLWLNPPYENIGPWVEKAKTVKHRAGWLLCLIPASIDANYFARHCEHDCVTNGVNPRIKFVGASASYPKSLMLCCYGFGMAGFGTWRWK